MPTFISSNNPSREKLVRQISMPTHKMNGMYRSASTNLASNNKGNTNVSSLTASNNSGNYAYDKVNSSASSQKSRLAKSSSQSRLNSTREKSIDKNSARNSLSSREFPKIIQLKKARNYSFYRIYKRPPKELNGYRISSRLNKNNILINHNNIVKRINPEKSSNSELHIEDHEYSNLNLCFEEFSSKFCRKVIILQANFMRPICILGPFTDIACNYLLKNYSKNFGYVKPNQNNSIETHEIMRVINEKRHPICIATPKVVEKMIDHGDFYPITIYCYTKEENYISPSNQKAQTKDLDQEESPYNLFVQPNTGFSPISSSSREASPFDMNNNIKENNNNKNDYSEIRPSKSNLEYIRQNLEDVSGYYDCSIRPDSKSGKMEYNWDVLTKYKHILAKNGALEITKSNIFDWKENLTSLIADEQAQYVWVNQMDMSMEGKKEKQKDNVKEKSEITAKKLSKRSNSIDGNAYLHSNGDRMERLASEPRTREDQKISSEYNSKPAKIIHRKIVRRSNSVSSTNSKTYQSIPKNIIPKVVPKRQPSYSHRTEEKKNQSNNNYNHRETTLPPRRKNPNDNRDRILSANQPKKSQLDGLEKQPLKRALSHNVMNNVQHFNNLRELKNNYQMNYESQKPLSKMPPSALVTSFSNSKGERESGRETSRTSNIRERFESKEREKQQLRSSNSRDKNYSSRSHLNRTISNNVNQDAAQGLIPRSLTNRDRHKAYSSSKPSFEAGGLVKKSVSIGHNISKETSLSPPLSKINYKNNNYNNSDNERDVQPIRLFDPDEEDVKIIENNGLSRVISVKRESKDLHIAVLEINDSVRIAQISSTSLLRKVCKPGDKIYMFNHKANISKVHQVKNALYAFVSEYINIGVYSETESSVRKEIECLINDKNALSRKISEGHYAWI